MLGQIRQELFQLPAFFVVYFIVPPMRMQVDFGASAHFVSIFFLFYITDIYFFSAVKKVLVLLSAYFVALTDFGLTESLFQAPRL